MRRDRLLVAASFAAMVGAAPAVASGQETGPASSQDSVSFVPMFDTARVFMDVTPPTTTALHTNASQNGLRAGVHSPVTATASGPSIARSKAGLGQDRAMMIVGGAAVVVGAIIGGKPGTFFMVGGAIVGLYGLYQYLQ